MTTQTAASAGDLADRLDNLLGATQLPMPAQFHLNSLKASLPGIRDRLRELHVLQTGENPWSTHPSTQEPPL